MNKKIVVGSVLAVFVLLAISLTSVIGGVDSSESGSPLYGVRTVRANDQESTVSDSADYIGEGIDTIYLQREESEEITEELWSVARSPSFCMRTCSFWPCLTIIFICPDSVDVTEVEYQNLI